MLTWEKHLPLAQGINEGELIAHINNMLGKTVSVNLKYLPSDGSMWDFIPRGATHVIQPGNKAKLVFKASYDSANLLPLPSYTYDISYGDSKLRQGSEKIVPALNLVSEWMVVGSFDLGVQNAPSSGSKLETAPPRFVQALEPEKNWDTNQTYQSDSKVIAWQEKETEEGGWMNFDSIYGGDFAIAYVRNGKTLRIRVFLDFFV